jgi:hypothetical protein
MKIIKDVAITMMIFVIVVATWLIIPFVSVVLFTGGLGFIIYLVVSDDSDDIEEEEID